MGNRIQILFANVASSWGLNGREDSPMRTLKSVFGVMRALVPIGYCGSLLYYFFDLSGSVEEVKTNGLGPTVLGLGAVGLVFSILLILRIVRIFARPPSPGSGGDTPAPDEESGFDADAAIARYLARQSAEAVPNPPAPRPALGGGGPARRTSFGRRTG